MEKEEKDSWGAFVDRLGGKWGNEVDRIPDEWYYFPLKLVLILLMIIVAVIIMLINKAVNLIPLLFTFPFTKVIKEEDYIDFKKEKRATGKFKQTIQHLTSEKEQLEKQVVALQTLIDQQQRELAELKKDTLELHKMSDWRKEVALEKIQAEKEALEKELHIQKEVWENQLQEKEALFQQLYDDVNIILYDE